MSEMTPNGFISVSSAPEGSVSLFFLACEIVQACCLYVCVWTCILGVCVRLCRHVVCMCMDVYLGGVCVIVWACCLYVYGRVSWGCV